MPLPLSRRSILAGASALGLACSAKEIPVKLEGPFPLGVASGDATPDGAVLWTYAQNQATLQLALWVGDDLTAPLNTPRRTVARGDDGYTSVNINGLSASTWYRFQFEAIDETGAIVEVSPSGRFRTALPADALESITLGAISCTKYGHSFATIERAAQAQNLDAFLMLGDISYNDGAVTLDEFRNAWARTVGSSEYRSLRASTSTVSLWDDHEIRNNWDADSVDANLYDNAKRAFLNHQPQRSVDGDQRRFWRKLSWGKTVDVFVLDARSERNRSRHEYLSAEQAQWLISGVAESQATFKLILNSVPIGAFDAPLFQPFLGDAWLAFPEQRAAILKGIEDSKATGVMWLSGDFHLACVGRVSRSGPGSNMLEFLVGPGAQSANIIPSYPGPPLHEWSSRTNNYVTFNLNPITREARVQYHSGEGKIIFDKIFGV